MTWREPWMHSPFDDMIVRLQEDIRQLFNELTKELHQFNPSIPTTREPLVDIFKDGKHLIIIIELPEVRKEDIHLKFLDNRRLYIYAENRNEFRKQLESAIHIERAYARFERVILLPYPVKPETAKAKFNNGVLEVKVEIDDKEIKKLEGIPVKIE